MYEGIKRFFDFIFSLLAVIILLPIFIPIVIALKLTGEGEIFYLQKRIGFKNQYFNIIKFATMLKNSMNMGTGSITLRNDPRVTWVGKYLRKSKLNELPQLWNVVRGDMSLVGPRPLVDKTFQAYPEDIRYRVYDSRPGITGIGSIVFRDEEEMISKATIPPHEFYEQVIAPYKGALEMWYQENKSFWTDFKILFLTVWVILFPKSRLMYQWLPNLPQKQS
jgi:lipopolysaccharide/colanic/teichoic acid biosynthesis glycosyltransferase